MKVRAILQWVFGTTCLWLSLGVFAGDSTCYGYKSTTSHFACTPVGNCVWWAAYKRPDLAAKITGSGWSGGEWYDKFKALGFPVGLEPRAGAIVELLSSVGHEAYVEQAHADGSFNVSEMDSTGSFGSGGVYRAIYSPNGDGTYNRNGSGKWTLKGFIYYKASCDPSKEKCALRKGGTVSWYPPINDCQQASQWFQLIYDNQNQVSRIEPTTKSACPQACFAN